MKTALIGYTGFVGSNLANSFDFDDVYNTSNIAELRGRSYDLVVSAANRADSFRINRDPDSDLREVEALAGDLESSTIGKLIVISTVCVYPAGGSPDEETALSETDLTPYGANRLRQERRLSDTFDTLILRLPQLYGDNLKKGIVFDLLNDYRVEHIRPDGVFQFYDVRRLWADAKIASDAGLSSLNLATAPVRNDVLAKEVFGVDVAGNSVRGPEDPYSRMYTRSMTTRFAALFGGEGPFLQNERQEIDGIRAFMHGVRSDRDSHS